LGNEFPKLALLVLAPLQSPCSALVGPSELPRPPDLLSWDSSRTCRSRCPRPLPPTSPPSVHSRQASLPGFGLRGTTSEVVFRPRGFAPPRRFAPLDGSRACCIPQPVVGFVAFPCGPVCRPHGPKTARAAPASPFPRRLSYPPKDSPRPQPYRVTAALAPLPLPSPLRRASRPPRCQDARCSRLGDDRSASRPCSVDESVPPPDRCRPDGGLSSHGLRSPPRSFGAAGSTATRHQRMPCARRSEHEAASGSVPLPSHRQRAVGADRPETAHRRAPSHLATRRRMPRSARGGAGTRETTMRASRS